MRTSFLQIERNPKATVAKHVARWLLGLSLIYAGYSHLTFNRTEFLAQVPNWLPMDPDFVVVASGVVEIVLGLSLLFLVSQRIWVGFLVGLFFVIIFPGNIAQYMNGIDAFGLNTDKARLIRLFFQPVLVLWALWSTGALQHWRENIIEK
jgi:uncharacterized membrane protein